MDYIKSIDEESVGKFTKEFIINYILGTVLVYILVGMFSTILSFVLSQLSLIVNILLTIFGFCKISTLAIKNGLKKANINSSNIKEVLKNIYIFLIVLLVINILYTYALFKYLTYIFRFNPIILGLTHLFAIFYIYYFIIINLVLTVIMMFFCKNKLEEIVLGKEINKTLYIVLLVIAVIIVYSSMYFYKSTYKFWQRESKIYKVLEVICTIYNKKSISLFLIDFLLERLS